MIFDTLLMMLISWAVRLGQCPAYKTNRLNEYISGYGTRTGEPIAGFYLVQEYERDHVNLFKKEVYEGNYLEWNTIDNNDLDDYCRRYLHQCVPGRNTCKATGSKAISKLSYSTPEYKFLKNHVVVVTCLNENKTKLVRYHITRALEPHCVYALKCGRGGNLQVKWNRTFSILNKHCNFEGIDYNICAKWHIYKENAKIVQLHSLTGQYTASYEVIKKYELEHQELHNREAVKNGNLDWPFVTTHNNLNEYCYKYLEKCTVNRNINEPQGSWKWIEVMWTSNKEKSTYVVAVKCFVPDRSRRTYYFTRSLDSNCVYALLHNGNKPTDPYRIVFKHCDFNMPNIKEEGTGSIDDSNLNMIPHKKIKSEDFPIAETLELFPNN